MNGAVTMPAMSAAIVIIAAIIDLRNIATILLIGEVRQLYRNVFIKLCQKKSTQNVSNCIKNSNFIEITGFNFALVWLLSKYIKV